MHSNSSLCGWSLPAVAAFAGARRGRPGNQHAGHRQPENEHAAAPWPSWRRLCQRRGRPDARRPGRVRDACAVPLAQRAAGEWPGRGGEPGPSGALSRNRARQRPPGMGGATSAPPSPSAGSEGRSPAGGIRTRRGMGARNSDPGSGFRHRDSPRYRGPAQAARPRGRHRPDAQVAEMAFQQRRQATGSDFLQLHLHRVVAISCALRERDSFRVWSLGSPRTTKPRSSSASSTASRNTRRSSCRGTAAASTCRCCITAA